MADRSLLSLLRPGLRRPGLVLALLLLGPTPATVAAQDRRAPFETLEVMVVGATNVNHNFLHTFWKPHTGGGLVLTTPFYLGTAEVGGLYHEYTPRSEGRPLFNAFFLFAGWGLHARPTARISWYNGFRVGNYRMSFDEDTFSGTRNESELTFALQSRLSLSLSSRIAVHLEGGYQKTYTFLRLKLFFVSAGLSYRLHSPAWLKELLQ